MTAATPTRPDTLAVHSVDEFVFSVPALEEARHFYTCFGLDVRDEGEALALYTHGHPHRWARVFQGGEVKRLAWLSLGIHAQDEARFERLLTQPPSSCPAVGDGEDLSSEQPAESVRQLAVVGRALADTQDSLRAHDRSS